MASLARDAGGPRLPIVVYPITDYGLVGDSYEKYANGYGILTRRAMVWFRDHYLRSPDDRRIGGLADQGGQPAGLAPAIVVTAECDVLHDEVSPMPMHCNAPACQSNTRSLPG